MGSSRAIGISSGKSESATGKCALSMETESAPRRMTWNDRVLAPPGEMATAAVEYPKWSNDSR
eukprot:3306450-Prymnesium_polylepis.1